METAVSALFATHGLDTDHLRTSDDHTYTSIEIDCPLCGDQLK